MEYPAKCRICYYKDTCDHKDVPSPTKGCYTHKTNCEIYAGSDPTKGIEGNCTCGFSKFNFNKYFENPKQSQPPSNQAVLTAFSTKKPRNQARSKATDTI